MKTVNLDRAIQILIETDQVLLIYRHALSILNFDGATVAPKRSAERRSKTMGYFGGNIHELMTGDEVREAFGTILDAGDAAEAHIRRRAELLKEESDDLLLVPTDEYAAYQALLAEADAVWHEAKLKSDWPSFARYLEKIVDYCRRYAARKNPNAPAYDVLVDRYEKGATTAMLDPFFAALRKDLTPVILAVAEKPEPDTAFLHRHYPKHLQQVFSDRLMAMMGINRENCAIAETEHPFTSFIGKHDVRITTHYHEDDVSLSMYSVIHESGHALYELNTGDELQDTCLAAGVTMGIHESQSRFYENLIGRSRPFCEALFPVLRGIFPEQTADADAEKLYRAVCRAKPSLIRTEADELTYPMHVMIRYELEKALVDGRLTVRDIPGEWNRMYQRYLGVTVPDDRRGCLQDSHWSFGGIGYFPSYALGSAYGVQMLDRMQREIDVWGPVAKGDLSHVTAWLREKIHRHGSFLRPAQVLENALGGPFDPSFYTRYLTEKYTALYGL